MILCALGNHPIDPNDPNLYRRVIGWERPGHGINGQSGSSLVLREKLPELACPVCITAAINRVHPAQESLL